MDTEGEISGQEGGLKVRVLQSEKAQTSNPADGSTTEGKTEFRKQAFPLYLPGLVRAHQGEVNGEAEGHHEGLAVIDRMSVHRSSALRSHA